MDSERRNFLTYTGAGLALSVLGSPLQALAQTGQTVTGSAPTNTAKSTRYALPKLPYAFNALEPHIDAQTMELHYTKHHQGYVDNLNKAEEALARMRSSGDFAMIQHWSRQQAFNYGGHVLHSIFWEIMASPLSGGGGQPDGELVRRITADFGSFESFKKQFSEAAIKVEGSGWALLHYHPADDLLVIAQAENQQKMAQWNSRVLLGLDVWEHAYYLKYQNRRAEYVTAWWNVVNWAAVANNLKAALTARG